MNCSDLMRAGCWISAQHYPGKFALRSLKPTSHDAHTKETYVSWNRVRACSSKASAEIKPQPPAASRIRLNHMQVWEAEKPRWYAFKTDKYTSFTTQATAIHQNRQKNRFFFKDLNLSIVIRACEKTGVLQKKKRDFMCSVFQRINSLCLADGGLSFASVSGYLI